MKKLLFPLCLCLLFAASNAQIYQLKSPDQRLSAEVNLNQGVSVKMLNGNVILVQLSDLGLQTQSGFPDFGQFQVKKVNRNSVDETVLPLVREKSETYRNQYNEMQLLFKSGLSITFRLFNEGLAYRFSTSVKDSLILLKENLGIQLADGDSIRYQPSKSFNSSYETPYEFTKVSGVENGALCHLPALIEKSNGSFVMITEADLYRYPGLWLAGTGKQELAATHPPYPKKYRYTGSIYDHGQIAEKHDYIARVSGTRTYPWRIFAFAEKEANLIANNMVYLLASPTELADVSWIKPSVVMFDWWGKSNIYGVNFKAGVNTETAKYYIDFCAANGFRYFLFDDGWCPKDNLLHEVPGLNMAEVTAYAKSKGVDVMLWVIWHAVQKQWDEAFDQFEKWGVKGIKMDFMNRDDQPMVEFYEAVARKAAEKKMVVNFHGAYKPCGLSRKYPNVLTREALIEFEYNGWTNSDNPVHHNLLPYIRMFTGPMDYIPATMRNSTKDNFRPLSDYPMGQGTRAHAMALFVILSSPMEMLPDSPSDYYREKECTQFLTKIPVEWDETHLLDGKIGKYTVLARRSGNEWYVGAITNWDERTIELPTDFLKAGNYRIEWIEDGINANSRAEDYKRMDRNFKSGEKLTLKLASGGGWVARIAPAGN